MKQNVRTGIVLDRVFINAIQLARRLFGPTDATLPHPQNLVQITSHERWLRVNESTA
jgi:hypothetical protein